MPHDLLIRAMLSSSGRELAEVAHEMTECEASGTPYLLDVSERALSDGARPSALRLDVASILALTNLVVGRFRHLPMRVALPSNRGLNLQLARGGLFFGLANRDEIEWVDGAPSAWGRLAEEWQQEFHPDDSAMFRDALVVDRDVTRDAWVLRAAFQRYLLSVIAIHDRPSSSIKPEIDRIAGRWLSQRLHVGAGSELAGTLLDCAEVFYEVLVNIPDHAGLSRTSSPLSLGQMFATLGGGRDSHNRLHFTAFDNGDGIPSTVRRNFQDRDRSPVEAVSDALTGALPGHGLGRGVGLSKVRRIADQYHQGLRAAGGASTVRVLSADGNGSAVSLDWPSGADDPTVELIEGLALQGTVVSVCLGLERRTIPADEADQLELTFDDELATT